MGLALQASNFGVVSMVRVELLPLLTCCHPYLDEFEVYSVDSPKGEFDSPRSIQVRLAS